MSLFKLKEVVELQPLVGEFFHTGSRVICNPPPQDTDDDYIVLVGQGAIQYVQQTLDQNGWALGGSFDPRTNKLANSPEFVSYKKDEYNLILTTNQDYFESFKRATYLASHLNLVKKEDRVTLFEAVVRDNYPTKLKAKNQKLRDWANYYFANNPNEPPPIVLREPDRLAGNPVGEVLLDNPAGEPDGPIRIHNPVGEQIARELEREAMAQEAREARIAREDAQIEEMFGHPNAELAEEIDAIDLERHAEVERELEILEANALRDAIQELVIEQQERELD